MSNMKNYSLYFVIIAILVKLVGVNWINKLMPAAVIGPTVALIGLSLAGNAIGDLTAGTATTVATQQAILCADAATTVYAEKTKVCINSTVEAITGIQQVIRPTVQADGLIYNLAGQPVGDNYKGIVIRNGKKYMVK